MVMSDMVGVVVDAHGFVMVVVDDQMMVFIFIFLWVCGDGLLTGLAFPSLWGSWRTLVAHQFDHSLEFADKYLVEFIGWIEGR
jgi:hypothetical protein